MSTLLRIQRTIPVETKVTNSVCVYLAGKTVHVIKEEGDSLFLGSVTSDADPWTIEIDITQIPTTSYPKLTATVCQKA